MKRHLLVTVSEDKSALFGIRFVGRFFENKESVRITLYYTAPRPQTGDRDTPSYFHSTESGPDYRKQEQKGNTALHEAKKLLLKYGFSDDAVEEKLSFRQQSKAGDIIQEAESGLYDAVVLGRRGLSRLEALLDDSVGQGLMDRKFTAPFWICRRPGQDRSGVLLCVDGSPQSYSMTDHVGFILGNETAHDVILLRIEHSDDDSAESEEIFKESKTLLQDNDVPEERIRTKTVRSDNVVRSILSEVETENAAVAAVGRTGAGAGLLQKMFMGSVSQALFKEISGAALWISH